jgi:hypothetical protein
MQERESEQIQDIIVNDQNKMKRATIDERDTLMLQISKLTEPFSSK